MVSRERWGTADEHNDVQVSALQNTKYPQLLGDVRGAAYPKSTATFSVRHESGDSLGHKLPISSSLEMVL